MKVALVHDHILEFGGAERVLVELKKGFPDADVYVAAYNKEVVKQRIPDFDEWNVTTSWVSKIPFYQRLYSPLRFLIPLVWESFDFTKYDVVISSSGWFMSKGIVTKPSTKHISYIHHPPASLYFYQSAVEWQKYWPIKIYAVIVGHFLRMWDYQASQRPDLLVANSKETEARINKLYRRDAVVVYPPVSIPDTVAKYKAPKQEYYVTLSRLAFKKHVDLLIETANTTGIRLKVIGGGRDEEALKKMAGPTVELLGYVPDKDFEKLFTGAKGFLFASEDEEFGIAPVEAMGYGVPVIAYASGGLKETVKHGKNGFLYKELSEESLHDAIKKLEGLSKKDYVAMREKTRMEAEKYTQDVFVKKMKNLVEGRT